MMVEVSRSLLLRSLLARYTAIRGRLAHRFGPQIAEDALQETWIRLETRADDLTPIKDPDAYVYRAALNTAHNLVKADSRRLTFVDIEELLGVVDDAPGPATIAADRADVAVVAKALSELTERQRIIFHEAFLGDVSHHELAERFGVGIRMIQKDLRRSIDLCARRLGKRKSFVTGAARLSERREEQE
jgi:RNA polymerase sigma factor (sigma-70 family)